MATKSDSQLQGDRGIIYDVCSGTFYILGFISIFKFFRVLFPRIGARTIFVDMYVLLNLLIPLILLLTYSVPWLCRWEKIAILYGGFRVFEMIVYQVNVLMFNEYRARKKGDNNYALRGYHRMLTLLVLNYVEIIFWFALFYRNYNFAFNTTGGPDPNSLFIYLNYSFVTLTTFGYSTIYPKEMTGYVLVLLQSIIGLFMTLMIFARFISLLFTPKTVDKFEK
jgi:hypothetical protein